jgi:hypothetical protein
VIIMESTNPICKQINELLDAFHDGELRGDEQTMVERHLKQCENCTARIADIDRVAVMLKNAPVPAREGLSARLDSVIDQQTKVVPMRRRATWAAGAVAAVAVIAAGLHFAAPGGDSSQAPTVAVKPPAPTASTVAVASKPSPVAAPQTTPEHESRTAEEPAQIASFPSSVTAAPQLSESHATSISTTLGEHGATRHETASTSTAHGGTSAGGPTSIAHSHSSNTDSVAIASLPASTGLTGSTGSATNVASTPSSEEIADLPMTTNSFNDAVGLSTDEDGLYDIKM